MLRKYSLGSEDKPGGTVIWFALIFDERGEMFVEMCHDLDQPYKNDRVTRLLNDEFDRFTVNGVSLRQLVVQKLDKLLPPQNCDDTHDCGAHRT